MNPSRDLKFKGAAVSKDVQSIKQIGLFLADQLFGGIFVGPLTVFFWWGTWSYLNTYLFPVQPDLSGLVCFAIGNVGLVILVFTQTRWKRYVCQNNAVHWVFGYHLYTCICAFFNVCHWRGMWTILDVYTGVDYLSCWATYAIGQGSLWVFRCSRNAQAPPMIIVHDRNPEFFTYTTRFRVQPQLNEKYVFDVLFTVTVVHQLVVFYWRGSWELMDLYLFPDNKTYSALVSLGIAYGLMIVLCFLQPLFNFLFRRFASSKNTRRFLCCWLLEVIIYFLSNFVGVGLWRGVWLFCDIYILPAQPDIGHGVLLASGSIGLMVMMCGHSLAIRGCDLDGDFESDGADVCMCPNFYFRKFYGFCSSRQVTDQPDAEIQQNSSPTEFHLGLSVKPETLIETRPNGRY